MFTVVYYTESNTIEFGYTLQVKQILKFTKRTALVNITSSRRLMERK